MKSIRILFACVLASFASVALVRAEAKAEKKPEAACCVADKKAEKKEDRKACCVEQKACCSKEEKTVEKKS